MDAGELLGSSTKWMHRALAAFGDDDDAEIDFVVHHVGVALEHLLKAYLVSLSAALVVDARSFDSLLHATGHGARARVPLFQVKTIGLVEAYERCKILMKSSLQVDDKRFYAIANGRNGVAHIGVHDKSEIEAILSTSFQMADVLLRDLNASPESYWGNFVLLHHQLIAENADRARARYEAKLANARATFRQRFLGMDRSTLDAVRTAIAASANDEQVPVHDVCPACGQQGWLDGPRHIEDDFRYLGNDEYDGGAWVVLTPTLFRCPFCRLELHDAELRLAGVEEKVNTDEDPSDYFDVDHLDDDRRRD